jgi:hypothetical protein
VCSSGPERFVKIDPETVEAMVADEGGAESEETFDGLRLRWTLEAKEELRRVPVAYMRRRATARIEKSARVRKLSTITRDFVQPIVHESILEGEAIGASPEPKKQAARRSAEAVAAEAASLPATETIQLGTFIWTHGAVDRLNRVPEGFMRDMTREKIEDYARHHQVPLVTLEVAEKGIEVGRQLMAEMIAGYSQAKREAVVETAQPPQGASVPAVQATVLNEVPSV